MPVTQNLLRLKLFIVIIFPLLISCRLNVRKQDSFKQIVTDTSLSHQSFNEINLSKEAAEELNIPYIHKGVDSFELRI